jgi:hypothetical protein
MTEQPRSQAGDPVRRHCTPVRLSRSGLSFQFGCASAPMIPHRVHTMHRKRPRRRPKTLQNPQGFSRFDRPNSAPIVHRKHAYTVPLPHRCRAASARGEAGQEIAKERVRHSDSGEFVPGFESSAWWGIGRALRHDARSAVRNLTSIKVP